jgi:hypothetical protein
MARKQIEGDNTPLGSDNTIGNKDAARPDQKAYKMWGVISTKHSFFAPRDKYKDIADILGLKDLDPNNDGDNDTQQNDNNIDIGGALQGVTGTGGDDTGNDYKNSRSFTPYIRIRATCENGSVMLVCDPEKLSYALSNLVGKDLYKSGVNGLSAQRIRSVNIPRKIGVSTGR